MDQGEPGRIGKRLSGVDSIEIKATIPHRQIKQALKRFRLTVDNDMQRFIYFFDTPNLDLYRKGVIARARRTVGEEHDSTIKFRPVEPNLVAKKWRKHPGFKIETDASEQNMVNSASFTLPVKKGVIKRVAVGERPVDHLFDEVQVDFLLSMGKKLPSYSELRILGPLMAHRWKINDPACPWPIAIELWKRADGATLMETSIRVPISVAAFALGGFMAHMHDVGVERDNAQQAKTRWALEYYADRSRSNEKTKPAGAHNRK